MLQTLCVCRGISDNGLQMLSSLQNLEVLTMNSMDAAVTGVTLTSFQGQPPHCASLACFETRTTQ